MSAQPAQRTEQEQATLDVVVADTGEFAHVFVHNDDVTPFDFVIVVLTRIFGLTWSKATAVTYRAHYTGVAHVITLPIEEAKYRVGNAHGAARQAGFPLTFSIEPVAD
jgi:ATP-dependent Clp protease adaptor protein ClpS